MNRILILVVLLLIALPLFAQNIKTFVVSECDEESDYDKVVNRISEQSFEDSILHIAFGQISNCAGINSPTVEYDNDTLYINYDDYLTTTEIIDQYDSVFQNTSTIEITIEEHTGFILLCECYYEFEFEITDLPKNPSVVILNGNLIQYYSNKYQIHPVEFELIDGDTINYRDKYGYRQGLWICKGTSGKMIQERHYQNDVIVKGNDYRYYENGNIKSKLNWRNGEHVGYFEYDSTGKIIAHKKSPLDED